MGHAVLAVEFLNSPETLIELPLPVNKTIKGELKNGQSPERSDRRKIRP